LLLLRGVEKVSDVRPFLAPDFKALRPPEALPGAVAAAERLTAAVRARRRIVIYGDYDVDGITATAILWHGLKLAGADVSFYIPSRLDEGYGLNADALARIAADGAQLLITVDCGITAVAAARRARELGLALIITDHHERPRNCPRPTAGASDRVRRQPESRSVRRWRGPEVGWALAQRMSAPRGVRPPSATTCSMRPPSPRSGSLPTWCRSPAKTASSPASACASRDSANPGLRALIAVANLTGKKSYDDYDVGFLLAPRLNAIGRMGHARLAVELFTRADAARAGEIAATLDAENRRRQEVERQIVKEAEALVVERGLNRESCRGIVLASPAWHLASSASWRRAWSSASTGQPC
jgi:single-stranded-DNA-specific exonuclease